MEKNKSIDGLSIRRVKTTQKIVKRGVVTRPVKACAPQKPTKQKISVFDLENNETIESSTVVAPRQQRTRRNIQRAAQRELQREVRAKSMASTDRLEAVTEDFLTPITPLGGENLETESMKSKIAETTAEAMSSKKLELKPKKAKRKVSRLRKIVTSVMLILIIGIIGVVIWALVWGNDIIAKITGGKGNIWDALSALTSETYEPLKTDANGRTNILAFGTSGYNMHGDEGNGIHDGAQLTDSLMAISIDQKTGDVAMISLPRDLKVRQACLIGKINEVFDCARTANGDSEEAGAQALMETVTEVLGLDFQYYVHVNWGSLVYIVDTLGGIKVTTDIDIDDRWSSEGATGMVIKAGEPTILNGEQALALARARHYAGGDDYHRGYNQQKILMGIKDKIYTTNLSLGDMLGMFSNLGDNLRTNLSVGEIKTAAHLTFEFNFDEIRQIKLRDAENGVNFFMAFGPQWFEIPTAGDGNFGPIREYVAEHIKEPKPEAESED